MAALGLFFSLAVHATAVAGRLDPGFGRHGVVTSRRAAMPTGSFTARNPYTTSLIVDESGRTIVLSDRGDLNRFLPDGRPDPRFGTHGSTNIRWSPDGDNGTFVSLSSLAGGSLLAGGRERLSDPFSALVSASGIPQPPAQALLRRSYDNSWVSPARTVSAPDGGSFVAFGLGSGDPTSTPCPQRCTVVMAFDQRGAPDGSFGDQGVAIRRIDDPGPGPYGAPSVLGFGRAANGRLRLLEADPAGLVTWGLTPDGQADLSYGAKLRSSSTDPVDTAFAPDGRFVWATRGARGATQLSRSTSDGHSDPRMTEFSPHLARPFEAIGAVAIARDGRVAVVDRQNGGAVALLTERGRPVLAFGDHGIARLTRAYVLSAKVTFTQKQRLTVVNDASRGRFSVRRFLTGAK
jgi:hypothetical protein